MKTLIAEGDKGVFGESIPPLDHDEWIERGRDAEAERQQEAAERESRDESRRAALKAKRRGGVGGGEDDEPTFAGHPLSAFDGKSDDEIMGFNGIGASRLHEIRAAQKKAGRK